MRARARAGRSRIAAAPVLFLLAAALVSGTEIEKTAPKVPGVLRLHTRSRSAKGKGRPAPAERAVHWNVAETAIIVCDMWDAHYCHSSEQRISVMAPRMNRLLTAARNLGVTIIHAPSGTMDFYADTPYPPADQRRPRPRSPPCRSPRSATSTLRGKGRGRSTTVPGPVTIR